MTWAVYLNETPLDSIGGYVEELTEAFSAPRRSYATVTIPGRQGVVVTGDPETQARSLVISGSIVPAAWTIAALRTATDQLKALAYRALIKVILDDDVNAPRQIDAVCEAVDITPIVHPLVTLAARFRISARALDPTWADVTGQLIAFGTTASPVPLGTAPSGGIVRITPFGGTNVVDPELIYRNAAGVEVARLVFSGTLTAGTEYLEIDLDRSTVQEVSSGVASNAISWLVSGDFFSLDPMDGDPLNGSHPQLQLAADSGTPTGTIAYPKRWL